MDSSRNTGADGMSAASKAGGQTAGYGSFFAPSTDRFHSRFSKAYEPGRKAPAIDGALGGQRTAGGGVWVRRVGLERAVAGGVAALAGATIGGSTFPAFVYGALRAIAQQSSGGRAAAASLERPASHRGRQPAPTARTGSSGTRAGFAAQCSGLTPVRPEQPRLAFAHCILAKAGAVRQPALQPSLAVRSCRLCSNGFAAARQQPSAAAGLPAKPDCLWFRRH